jgi:pimeloyl-ACP methyl ester carboxylesterase
VSLSNSETKKIPSQYEIRGDGLSKIGLSSTGSWYRASNDLSTQRPLVLLMGWAGAIDSWTDAFLSALSSKRPVIAIDPPGTGRASKDIKKERLVPATAAADVLAALKELGVCDFHLLGYSWGGVIAMHAAMQAQQNVASLTLVATTAGGKRYSPPPRGILAALAAPAGETLSEKTESIWKICLGSDRFEQYRTAMTEVLARQGESPTPSWVLREQLGHYMAFDLANEADDIRVPTLVLTGDEDPLTPAQNSKDLAEALSQSRLEILKGVRHMPHIEKPGLFASLVLDFVSKDECHGVQT